MKSLIHSLVAVVFASTLLSACGAKEEAAPVAAPEPTPVVAPAPAAPEPVKEEPGGWVPPPADAAPAAPAAEATPAVAPAEAAK